MLETINENSQDENDNGEAEPRRSKRARVEKYFGPNFLTYMAKGNLELIKR